MYKKFLIGMAALCVSLFFIGCETEVEVDKWHPGSVIHVEEVVSDGSSASLKKALEDYDVIEVSTAPISDLGTDVPEIPEGKTLVLRTSVTPGSGGLTVNGTVYVEFGGTLVAADGTKVIVEDGIVNVSKGGTLSVATAASVTDGTDSVLDDTSKVSVQGGTLAYAGAADEDEVAEALTWVTSGTLAIGTLDTLKPTEVIAISGYGAEKTLEITANGAVAAGDLPEDNSLTIPEGLDLTTSDTLAAVTGDLTVNGGLTLTGAAVPTGDIVVEGALTVSGSGSLAIAAGKELTVGSKASFTAGLIKLGAGTWTATSAATTITVSVITLGNDATAAFGKDDGTQATVLTGKAQTTNTFTATVKTVTLGQSGNKLTITGSEAGGTLATGTYGGIKVKAGLVITDVTLDITAANTSIITLVNGDTEGITLASADSIIKLDSGTTGNTLGVDKLSLGSNVVVNAVAATTGSAIGNFTGAASENTIKEDDSSDVEIKKGLVTK